MTEIGRRQMLSELQSLIHIFMEADRAIDPIYNPILEEFGVTEERIEILIKEMVKDYLSNEISDEWKYSATNRACNPCLRRQNPQDECQDYMQKHGKDTK